MSDGKPLASLSSSLLARKGHAKPAMRPQAIQRDQSYAEGLEDLGWNDMGHEPDDHQQITAEPVALPGVEMQPQVMAPAVREQQDSLAREFRAPVPASVIPAFENRAPRANPGSKSKSAFTLRIDSERHLQLRLVCAVKHKSAQQVVTQALDEFLARQPKGSEFGLRARGQASSRTGESR